MKRWRIRYKLLFVLLKLLVPIETTMSLPLLNRLLLLLILIGFFYQPNDQWFIIKDQTFCWIWLFQGLYLGSVAAASNKNVLKSYNVTHILTVASSLRPAHPDDFVYKVVRGINLLKVSLCYLVEERICFWFWDGIACLIVFLCDSRG
jgi:hypothetical protein